MSCGRGATMLKPKEIWLNRYGSMATRKSIAVLRARVLPVSTGSTDITSVYRNQTKIRIRKLKPNVAMLPNSIDVSVGLLVIRFNAPLDKARPKIRSDSDWSVAEDAEPRLQVGLWSRALFSNFPRSHSISNGSSGPAFILASLRIDSARCRSIRDLAWSL